jgi:hypothetical protein
MERGTWNMEREPPQDRRADKLLNDFKNESFLLYWNQ